MVFSVFGVCFLLVLWFFFFLRKWLISDVGVFICHCNNHLIAPTRGKKQQLNAVAITANRMCSFLYKTEKFLGFGGWGFSWVGGFGLGFFFPLQQKAVWAFHSHLDRKISN